MKKKIISFLLLLAVIITIYPTTLTHASTQRNLVIEHTRTVSQSSPYTSITFTPMTNRVSYQYFLWYGISTYTSTLNIQRYVNGSWVTEDYYLLKGGSTISSDFFVTAGSTYRFKITSTDPQARKISLDSYEFIE